MHPETQRIIELLKVCLRVLGVTNREVARRMGMSPSYLSKLLSGASELRVDHIIRILQAIDFEPGEFFTLAYPRPPLRGSFAAAKLRELLQQLPPPPPPPPAERLTEEEIERMMKAALEKLTGRTNGT